jgi:hypothetical protein
MFYLQVTAQGGLFSVFTCVLLIYLFIHVCIYLFIYLFIYLLIYSFIDLFIYLFARAGTGWIFFCFDESS